MVIFKHGEFTHLFNPTTVAHVMWFKDTVEVETVSLDPTKDEGWSFVFDTEKEAKDVFDQFIKALE